MNVNCVTNLIAAFERRGAIYAITFRLMGCVACQL